MAEKKRNSYDNLVMDIMHISKSEYDLLTQRNNDLENYTNHLIEKNNELRKENEMLKQELFESEKEYLIETYSDNSVRKNDKIHSLKKEFKERFGRDFE